MRNYGYSEMIAQAAKLDRDHDLCPQCGGKGWEEEHEEAGRVSFRCRLCGGSGTVKREVSEVVAELLAEIARMQRQMYGRAMIEEVRER